MAFLFEYRVGSCRLFNGLSLFRNNFELLKFSLILYSIYFTVYQVGHITDIYKKKKNNSLNEN